MVMRLHMILRRVCDVSAAVVATVAIGAFANAWWHPGEAGAQPGLRRGGNRLPGVVPAAHDRRNVVAAL